MLNMHKKYPSIAFNEHKGYGTKKHFEKNKEPGICDIHLGKDIARMLSSFAKNGWCVGCRQYGSKNAKHPRSYGEQKVSSRA